MVCFVRRSPIDYDVRLQKYVEACENTATPWMALTWDRQLNSQAKSNEIQYRKSAPYGGGWKNLIGLIGWQFFIWSKLLKNFRRYKVIHACNLEVFLSVLPFKLFGKKVMFDIYDSVNINLESKTARFADVVILPHRKRLGQIKVQESDLKRLLEVENVPGFADNVILAENDRDSSMLRLSYVGVFEKNDRGLENILKIVSENPKLSLDIAGVGGGLEPVVVEYSKTCSRIKYYGQVDYKTALTIMGRSDIIMALYYMSNPLHEYASPNKYYESLYLGKPIITSKNTLVGNRVEEDKTGYAISDGETALKDVLEQITRNDLAVKSLNCRNKWETVYSNYGSQILNGEYIETIIKLSKQ